MNLRSVILLLTALAACGQPAEKATAPSLGAIPVVTAPVEKTERSQSIGVSGLTASEQEARLSFKTGGVIQFIAVREGERVRKGALLARLNLTEIEAQVHQARVALAKAERDYQRAENLYRDSVATLEQVQNAQSGLEVARQALTIAEYNLGFSEIRAPHEGVVLKKLMNEGEVAGPGMPVLFVSGAGPSDWVLRAGLTDRDWVRMQIGLAATVELDAFPGVTFPARLTTLAQAADPYSGLYPAEFRIMANGKALAPGLFGKATLSVEPTGAGRFRIPLDALMEGNGNQAFVFVPQGDRAVRHRVRVAFIEQDQAIIAEGLDSVRRVITGGSAYLIDGSLIQEVSTPQHAQR